MNVLIFSVIFVFGFLLVKRSPRDHYFYFQVPKSGSITRICDVRFDPPIDVKKGDRIFLVTDGRIEKREGIR